MMSGSIRLTLLYCMLYAAAKTPRANILQQSVLWHSCQCFTCKQDIGHSVISARYGQGQELCLWTRIQAEMSLKHDPVVFCLYSDL